MRDTCACSTGFCVDGVCCNTYCGYNCDVCSKAAGGAADGQCVNAPLGAPGSLGLLCDPNDQRHVSQHGHATTGIRSIAALEFKSLPCLPFRTRDGLARGWRR